MRLGFLRKIFFMGQRPPRRRPIILGGATSGKTGSQDLAGDTITVRKAQCMSNEMKTVVYSLWLVFVGIYFLQGAITGSLRKGGRGRTAARPIPGWARLACLLVAGSFGAAAVLVFVSAFPK